MDLTIKALDRSAALRITAWKYPQPYAIYNLDADQETLAEILGGNFYSAFQDRELVGYFCFGHSAQVPWGMKKGYYPPGNTDIGLAMRPDLTGRGLGLSFFQQGLDLAHTLYPSQPVRLTVAAFNQRAQKVYQRAGFVCIGGFTVPGGKEFLIMRQSPGIVK